MGLLQWAAALTGKPKLKIALKKIER